jgi:hypothetical protein
MLRRLAWSSVPSPSFSPARLNEIIALSGRNNERNQISGMLSSKQRHESGPALAAHDMPSAPWQVRPIT